VFDMGVDRDGDEVEKERDEAAANVERDVVAASRTTPRRPHHGRRKASGLCVPLQQYQLPRQPLPAAADAAGRGSNCNMPLIALTSLQPGVGQYYELVATRAVVPARAPCTHSTHRTTAAGTTSVGNFIV
jgi:hypothetical protein